MAVVDAHIHAFSSERAGLIAQGGLPRAGFVGVVEEVDRIHGRGRIGQSIVMAAAPVELWRRAFRQRGGDEDEIEPRLWSLLVEQNEWVCQAGDSHDGVVPAIGADATLPSQAMVAEIRERVARHRVRAVKIHPALNFVYPTHPGYGPIYETAQEAGLVVVSHGGAAAPGLYDSEIDYCEPANFRQVLEQYPELKLVVAHLAFPYVDDLLALAAAHANLYTDLSFVVFLEEMQPERLRDTIRSFGVERVLFGSDFPYFDPEDGLDRLAAAGLGDAELEMVSESNARELYGLG